MGGSLLQGRARGAYRIPWIVAACLTLSHAPVPLAWAQPGFSGSGQFAVVPVDEALSLPAWNRLAEEFLRDQEAVAACMADGACEHPVARRLASFLEDIGARSRPAQLRAVNRYVNRVPYARDATTHGVHDFWQSPLTFLATAGDCEDYAISKYLALRLLGFAEEDLELIVLIDEQRRQPHAVLLVRDDERLWVLDNRRDELAGSFPRNYRPVYAVNQIGRWLFAARP